MGVFGSIPSPFALKRLIAELRGLRKAAERVAAVLELQAQHAPRPGAQTFRSFSYEKVAGDGQGSSVSYTDPAEAALAFEKEIELVGLLGRSPTPEELQRAMDGDIE